MQTTEVTTGYADVNGLQMYYEIHGDGDGVPLVMLHGGISAIAVDFGALLPVLAADRRVIGIEQQAHGHTGDIDRPLSFPAMADDTAALLQSLDVAQADLFGFSVGAAIATELAIRYPALVRKLILVSGSFSPAGDHPGQAEGMQQLTPDMLIGTPYYDHYQAVAPNPDDWGNLIEKIKGLSADWEGWTPEQIAAIGAPTLIILADSDIIQPEHAVEMFRLRGGGVNGAIVGLPASQLAILPGTTHLTIMQRTAWIGTMVDEFLAAPLPEATPAAG